MANIAITIDGILGINGRYEIDANYFTNRELHTIKKISGIRAGELSEAIDAGDSDLIVALAAVALGRNGKQVPVDVLWDAPAGRIAIEAVIDEDEAGADVVPPTNGAGSSSGAETTNPTSGESSTLSGGDPANSQSPTGFQHSASDAIYAQQT